METLSTIIEFIGPETSDAEAVGGLTGATSDPLFSICAILVAVAAVGMALFLYARHNKVAASIVAKHAGPAGGMLHAIPDAHSPKATYATDAVRSLKTTRVGGGRCSLSQNDPSKGPKILNCCYLLYRVCNMLCNLWAQ